MGLDFKHYSKLLSAGIPRSSERVKNRPYYYDVSWFVGEPSLKEQISSNYSVTYDDFRKTLQQEFFEEVALIQKELDKYTTVPPESESKAFWKSVNNRAVAINVWDNVAMPLRVQKGLVLGMQSPSDILGAPIISVVNTAEGFAKEAIYKIGDDQVEIYNLKRMQKYLLYAVGGLVGLVVYFVMK